MVVVPVVPLVLELLPTPLVLVWLLTPGEVPGVVVAPVAPVASLFVVPVVPWVAEVDP